MKARIETLHGRDVGWYDFTTGRYRYRGTHGKVEDVLDRLGGFGSLATARVGTTYPGGIQSDLREVNQKLRRYNHQIRMPDDAVGKMAIEKKWVPYYGPEGGEGWQNQHDEDDIRYQENPPGEVAYDYGDDYWTSRGSRDDHADAALSLAETHLGDTAGNIHAAKDEFAEYIYAAVMEGVDTDMIRGAAEYVLKENQSYGDTHLSPDQITDGLKLGTAQAYNWMTERDVDGYINDITLGDVDFYFREEFWKPRDEKYGTKHEDPVWSAVDPWSRTKEMFKDKTALMWQTAWAEFDNEYVPRNKEVLETQIFDREHGNDAAIAEFNEYRDRMHDVYREAYGDRIPVFRGIDGESRQIADVKAEIEAGNSVELREMTLTSWATDPATAYDFAEDGGVIIRKEIPIEDIMVSADTHPGLLSNENEFVVGTDDEWAQYDPDQVVVADESDPIDHLKWALDRLSAEDTTDAAQQTTTVEAALKADVTRFDCLADTYAWIKEVDIEGDFEDSLAAKEWEPYEGPQGGEGWYHPGRDEVRYTDDPPGDGESGDAESAGADGTVSISGFDRDPGPARVGEKIQEVAAQVGFEEHDYDIVEAKDTPFADYIINFRVEPEYPVASTVMFNDSLNTAEGWTLRLPPLKHADPDQLEDRLQDAGLVADTFRGDTRFEVGGGLMHDAPVPHINDVTEGMDIDDFIHVMGDILAVANDFYRDHEPDADYRKYDPTDTGPADAITIAFRPGGITKDSEWQPYEGPQGGEGWRNPETDEVRYVDEKPGTASPDGPETPTGQPETEIDHDRDPVGEVGVEVSRLLQDSGHDGYVVGGTVRDHLYGIESNDIDMTTDARPEETIAIYEDAGYRVVPTGIEHGTVTVLVDDEPIEITTYRVESDYDGRRPDSVEFVDDVEADLGRRDLTINAMAYDPLSGDVVDPYGGQQDLEHEIVQTVGDPMRRFTEDGLRAFRALRFSSKLGFDIEDETYQTLSADAVHDVIADEVSAERIRKETTKALLTDAPSNYFRGLLDTGLSEYVAPELDAALDAHTLDVLEATPPEKETRLAALLRPLDTETAGDVLERLRYPNKTIDTVTSILEQSPDEIVPDMSDADLRVLVADAGRENFTDVINLHRADRLATGDEAGAEAVGTLVDRYDALEARGKGVPDDLALDGGDVIQLGLEPGPEISVVLDHLYQWVLEDPARNDPERLADEALRYIHAEGLEKIAARAETLAKEWQPYRGPRGGQGWYNPATDERRYQEDRPDDTGAVNGQGTDRDIEWVDPPNDLDTLLPGVRIHVNDDGFEMAATIERVQSTRVGPHIIAMGDDGKWYELGQGSPVGDPPEIVGVDPESVDEMEETFGDDPVWEDTEDASYGHTYDPAEEFPETYCPEGYEFAPNEIDEYEDGDIVLYFDASVSKVPYRGHVIGTYNNDSQLLVKPFEGFYDEDAPDRTWDYMDPEDRPEGLLVSPFDIDFRQTDEGVTTGYDYESVTELLDAPVFSYSNGHRDDAGVQHRFLREYLAGQYGNHLMQERRGISDPHTYHDVLKEWRVGGYYMSACWPVWEAANRHTPEDEPYHEDVTPHGPRKDYAEGLADALDETIHFCQAYFRRFVADGDNEITIYRGIAAELAADARDAKENGEPLEIDPRAMESWSMQPDKAETYGMVLRRTITPDDVGFYGPITLPGMATTEEVTVLGHEPYEIPPEDIDIDVDALDADAEDDQ